MSSLGSDAGLLTLQKWGHPTYFIFITYAWQCLGMHGQPVYGSSPAGEGRMRRKWAVTANWQAGTILRTVLVRARHLLLSKSKLQSSRRGHRWKITSHENCNVLALNCHWILRLENGVMSKSTIGCVFMYAENSTVYWVVYEGEVHLDNSRGWKVVLKLGESLIL